MSILVYWPEHHDLPPGAERLALLGDLPPVFGVSEKTFYRRFRDRLPVVPIGKRVLAVRMRDVEALKAKIAREG